MKSPRDKYINDNTYKMLVDSMVHLIHNSTVTPSELREAAILAFILYEEKQMQRCHCMPDKIAARNVSEALKRAWDWACQPSRKIKEINENSQ